MLQNLKTVPVKEESLKGLLAKQRPMMRLAVDKELPTTRKDLIQHVGSCDVRERPGRKHGKRGIEA